MLGKLIKYEFKATYRFMVMLYVILFVVSLFTGLSHFIGDYSANFSNSGYGMLSMSIIRILLTIIFAVMMLVVIFAVLFYSINRFKNSLLGNGGYLYNTLPVKTHNHILAKMITAIVWSVASGIVAVLAFLLMFSLMSGNAVMFFKELTAILGFIWRYISDKPLMFILDISNLITALAATYIHIFASMAIGYSSNRFRAWKSVGVYVLIRFIISVTSSFGMSIAPLSGDVYSFEYTGIFGDLSQELIFKLIYNILFATALFFITKYFLKNKLNLQ